MTLTELALAIDGTVGDCACPPSEENRRHRATCCWSLTRMHEADRQIMRYAAQVYAKLFGVPITVAENAWIPRLKPQRASP